MRRKNRWHYRNISPFSGQGFVIGMGVANRRTIRFGEKLISEMFKNSALVKAGVFHHIMRANRGLVRNRQMIAFHEIFSQAFPVTIPLMLFGKDGYVMSLSIGRGDLGQGRQHFGNRCNIWI